ncbi:SRPBCC family protein, partial [Achromobacter insolitus]
PAATAPAAAPAAAVGKKEGRGSQIDGGFTVPFPAAEVWAFMVDLPALASCLPGASIEEHEGDRVKGKIAIKFGPMSAAFNGAARLERDDAAMQAVFRGAGQDSLSQSRANGDITYRLEALSPTETQVHVNLLYSLQGPLAQFSRSGLVQDFVRRMIADFGNNVTARLRRPAAAGEAPAQASFNPTAMFFSVLWARIKRWFGRGG